MKKAKKAVEQTDNSRVYKMAARETNLLHCPICSPNKGCNANRTNEYKSWKYWRKEQWKN